MPLDFRNREEEGFSIKRFLKTVGAGVAVFLAFLAVGYYFVGPRIMVSESGRVQLRLSNANAAAPAEEPAPANAEKPMPKVEVYEKLSPEVTAGSGVIIGSREVAPFDYERYQQKRRERRPKPQETPTPEETPPPIEDEYFVPDDAASDDTPVSSDTPEPAAPEPAPTPTEPKPAEPPATTPATPPAPSKGTETSENTFYRVQVGVYESRENANHVAQRLVASGYEATIVPFQRNGKTVYRVQTLVTSDKTKADSLKNRLESQGFPAVVVQVR